MPIKKYEGDWNKLTAKHLLNRVTYSISRDALSKVVGQGMEASVNELLTDLPMPLPPVNPTYDVDPNVPIGETWVDKPEGEGTATFWFRSLRWWGVKNVIDEGCSAREKMTLFWHNHFVTSTDLEPMKFRYQYLNLLRTFAFGNFRELTKQMTVNASMLFYLNGDTNTAEAPNENYARELFELFTVGKGDIVGPGDYSRFTETDVLEAAKILTGWTTDYNPDLAMLPQAQFNEQLHDNSSKQLSQYFNNAIIEGQGASEYEALIDLIFESENTALNIIRELYIWFVHYEIDDAVELEVIRPLAELLIESNYDIKPVLKDLFESEHFYNADSFGGKIKSPIDLVLGFTKTFNVTIPESLYGEFHMLYGLTWICEDMGQTVSRHPTVAGWKAFYQSPNFYKSWIDAITLPLRMSFLENAVTDGMTVITEHYQVDVIAYVGNIENAADPNVLIMSIADIIYSNPLKMEQLVEYKNTLIPGLPDFEWTVEYEAYLANPTDEAIKLAVENRLSITLREHWNKLESTTF